MNPLVQRGSHSFRFRSNLQWKLGTEEIIAINGRGRGRGGRVAVHFFVKRYAMGVIVESGALEATVCGDRIEASSVIGPHTPEAAAKRRTRQTLLISDTESYDRDFDDEEMESVRGDDDADLVDEPVAMSRVRAFALARRSTGGECKVTLENARAKLDSVRAARENHCKKRKLEDFLGGELDGGVSLLLHSEFQGQPKVVKKRFSVEKARAKLEAVKVKKQLDETNINKHLNMYITSSLGKVSRKASKACSIEELLHEGVWVRQAKLKLRAAREWTLKSNRKRKSKALGTKKRNMHRRSSLEVSCVGKEDKEDDIDLIHAADGVKVAVDSVVSKDPSLKGKRRKASKQKAVRVSERIANRRLRMQQELLTLKVKSEIGSKKTKLGRTKRSKQEELNTNVRTDLSGTRENTEATNLEWDTESSAVVSSESISSVKLTPPAKRRKIQKALVDIIPPPGARLSSGVACVPPVSPYGLIQEHFYRDPWKVLVACILLNQTGGRQMHKVIWDLFELCPDAETCVSTETEKIGRVIHSLGLQNKRAKTLQRFSQDYLTTTWTNVAQLHGIGEYGRDAYAIFCEGRWQDVQPKDLVLNKYCRWLNDTQGLGYGFSQID